VKRKNYIEKYFNTLCTSCSKVVLDTIFYIFLLRAINKNSLEVTSDYRLTLQLTTLRDALATLNNQMDDLFQ